MEEGKTKKIIVKRVRKHHTGSHGGSWKVAYADFITAMMAFFLVMWLLTMTSKERRVVLAEYFRNFSLFTHSGESFMYKGGRRPAGENYGGQQIVDGGQQEGGITNNKLASRLLSGVGEVGPAAEKQVFVSVTAKGVRIEIVDTKKHPIFPPGSADITELGRKIISVVVGVIKNFPNKIAVEGHTDSSPPGPGQMSNWELSVARALTAKRVLQKDGIDPIRICRVVGFADRVPIFPIDDPRNRRISILFCTGKKQKPRNSLQWLLKPAG